MPRKTNKRESASAHADLRAGDPFSVKPRKAIPHEFVLEALAPASPWTRPMFGCTAVYVGEKIVLILRQRPRYERDNGVWLATTHEHHESLRQDFPNMRSIELLAEKVSQWQVLPVDAPDFEESALHACELVLANDPRLGKTPGRRRASFKAKPGRLQKRKPQGAGTARRRKRE
jgi:hypothetical protein